MLRLILATLMVFPALAQDGKRQYEARCAGCHGADGNGGGHGRGIAATQRDAAAIREVILKGIPAVGMPAFAIPPAEAETIAAYVVSLRPAAATAGATGDIGAGERLYNDRNCAACHMIRGRGGIAGPDLSTVGRDRPAAQIEQALRDPGSARGAVPTAAVSVRLRDGRTLRGHRQKRKRVRPATSLGRRKLHLLSKDQVAEIVREKSLMPKLDGTRAEMRDLVAYLGFSFQPDRPSASSAPACLGTRSCPPASPARGPPTTATSSGNRFSPLDQINTVNVGRLAPKWMFTVPGAPRALEMTPVVVDGVMYVTAVNEAFALDARSGREIWHYSRPRTTGLAGDAASGINRGVAVLGDRVFMVTDNAHLFALHRLTGQLMWDVEMADSRQNYGATGAPLVVNDLVIAGVSGGDEGVRGFLDAYKRPPASASGASGRFPRRASPGRRPGAAARSNTAAARPGSPAPTIPKPACSTGPPAIPARTTTATSARATTCTPLRWWRSIPPRAS